MSPNVPDQAELLRQHGAWVRALARRLAADAHGAEDLEQETWLAVLRRPADGLRSPRAWLAGVVANLARAERRAGARRRSREETRDSAEGAPAADDALERAGLGRELADLVLALEEPFRTAVVLRFYEDLPPRAIAAQLGVSVRTVDSRLARGLARLRERWRRRHGEGAGDAWLASLALLAGTARPTAPVPPVSASSTPGSASGAPGGAGAVPASLAPSTLPLSIAVMNVKLVLVVALLAAGGVLWFLWDTAPDAVPVAAAVPGPRGASVRDAEPAGGTERPPEPTARSEPASDAARSAAAPAPEPAPPSASRAPNRVRGRVLDAEALPLGGVEVAFRAGGSILTVPGRSGADGTFELEVPPVAGRVVATSERWVTLREGVVGAPTEVEALVVVAGRCRVAGRVVDAAGAPLEGAVLRFEPPVGWGARFEALTDATQDREWTTRTDAQGRFGWPVLPVVQDALLEVSLDGYTPARLPAPVTDEPALVVVLERSLDAEAALAGVVLDPQGDPVPGARVSLGAGSATTDRAGEFRLSRDGAEDAFEMRAVRPGHLPGVARAVADAATGAPVWPERVVVRLGGPPLSIAGRVVDGAGKPRAGVTVWIEDPTPFGTIEDDMSAQVEFLLAADADEDPNWVSTTTRANGRFRLEGLLPRDYRLRLQSDDTLEATSAGPFSAGTSDVRVVFERAPLVRLAGRVVTSAGAPVAGASLLLLRDTFGGVSTALTGSPTVTDAEGRFAFEGVGGRGLHLWVRGDDVVPTSMAVPDEHLDPDAAPMEVVVAVRCHLKIELSGAPDEARWVCVLDGAGAELDLFEVGASGVTRANFAPLVEGRSVTLGVADTARTLVLYRDGEEVRRVPLDLVPGRLNLVRP